MRIPPWLLALALAAAAGCAGGAEGCGAPASNATAADDENWHNCPSGTKPVMRDNPDHTQPFQCR